MGSGMRDIFGGHCSADSSLCPLNNTLWPMRDSPDVYQEPAQNGLSIMGISGYGAVNKMGVLSRRSWYLRAGVGKLWSTCCFCRAYKLRMTFFFFYIFKWLKKQYLVNCENYCDSILSAYQVLWNTAMPMPLCIYARFTAAFVLCRWGWVVATEALCLQSLK